MCFLGKIGITLDISFPHPKTDSAEDKTAAELALQFYVSKNLQEKKNKDL